MDISGLGASKLLEALEKLGVSKGAELRSLGPQGEPPAELVRAFEDALRAPDGQGGPSVQGVAEGSREHGPFEESVYSQRRLRGIRKALEHNGIELEEKYIFYKAKISKYIPRCSNYKYITLYTLCRKNYR